MSQAVGLGLYYVKLGGLSGAERMTKYNRLISIEEELAQQGSLGRFYILLPFLFLARQGKGGQTKPEREVVVPGLENTSVPISFCFGCKGKVCVNNHTNVYVCV